MFKIKGVALFHFKPGGRSFSPPATFMFCSLVAISLALCYRYQNARTLMRSRQRSNINPKLVRCFHFVLPDPNINKHPRARAQNYSGENTGTLRPNTPPLLLLLQDRLPLAVSTVVLLLHETDLLVFERRGDEA